MAMVMGQLFFKKPLQDAIREGRKRTTIRRWDRPRLHAGQQAFAPGVGWLAIERVEPVDLATLADADAVADGFASLRELRQVLLELYPDHARDGKDWFRVCFSVSRLLEKTRADAVPDGQGQLFEGRA
jgi:hypothetical protein